MRGRTNFVTLSLYCLIWGLGFCFITGFLYVAGVRVNVSSSLSHRVWMVQPIAHDEDISRGDFVVVAPSRITGNWDEYIRSTYFGGLDFLKEVAGIPCDLISEDFKVLSVDSSGHALPSYPLPTVLGRSEYWLTSDKERGFDSRYFGPVNRQAIKAKAKPLF